MTLVTMMNGKVDGVMIKKVGETETVVSLKRKRKTI